MLHVLLMGLVISQGRLKITIDDPSFKPIQIAVTDLAGATPEVNKAITETLRNDLDFSYVFTSLNPKSFLVGPSEPPKYADWINAGAQGLVQGTAKVFGERVFITYKFFDVATQKEVLSKTYDKGKDGYRTIAHEFADELVALYTGQKGVFSTQIAFAARAENNATHIWVMDFDGTNPRKLAIPAKLNLLPAWDRTGSEVLYTTYAKDNPDLYAFSLLTQKTRVVSAQHGLNSGASVAPDGKRVAMTLSRDGNSEIYVGDIAGGGAKRLTENWWIDTSPSWSPDGARIAYVSSKTGNPHIYVMNADGSGQKRVTFQGNYNQTPDWSPKGNAIAFTARDERYHFDIFAVDPASNDIKRLTQDAGNNEEPSYSPDGRLIAFVSDRSGKRKVWVMNADGSKPRQIYTGGADCETPSWSPRRP